MHQRLQPGRAGLEDRVHLWVPASRAPLSAPQIRADLEFLCHPWSPPDPTFRSHPWSPPDPTFRFHPWSPPDPTFRSHPWSPPDPTFRFHLWPRPFQPIPEGRCPPGHPSVLATQSGRGHPPSLPDRAAPADLPSAPERIVGSSTAAGEIRAPRTAELRSVFVPARVAWSRPKSSSPQPPEVFADFETARLEAVLRPPGFLDRALAIALSLCHRDPDVPTLLCLPETSSPVCTLGIIEDLAAAC